MNGNSYTSFMDVIACGLGAAIFLFLIGASTQRGFSDAPPDHTLLVRCELLDGNAASIGIEYLAPNASSWQLADTKVGEKEGFVLASSSREDGNILSFPLLFPRTLAPGLFVLFSWTTRENKRTKAHSFVFRSLGGMFARKAPIPPTRT
ncbi:MAG: hypothetical protein Q4D38_04710 [Planctomycetia bacterium]|nr:hypothetical protein [Planctomycetia bacterium]